MKYIGIDETVLRSKNGYYAAFEIERQPKLWKEIYESVKNHKDEIMQYFQKLHKIKNLRVLLVGAGSSNLAAKCIENHVRVKHNWDVICEPSTKIILNPESYFEEDVPLLLVSFGSSGSTPESIACNRLAKKLVKDLFQIIIVCVEDGIIIKENDASEDVLYIPLPKETKGKSFAATAEFTCLVMQAMLIFDIENIDDYEDFILYLEKEADYLFHENIHIMHEIAECDTDMLTALGSCEMETLAAETALKAVEFTSGNYYSNYNSSIEFRHGPKLILSSPVLCVFFIHPDCYIQKYDFDMMSEVSGDDNNAVVIGIGYHDLPKDRVKPNFYYQFNHHHLFNEIPVAGIYLYALVMQTFITLISLKKGINADWPSRDDLVPKVANRVFIYDKEEC